MKKAFKFLFVFFLFFLIIIGIYCRHFLRDDTAAHPEPLLKLSVQQDPEAFTQITPDKIGMNFSHDLIYYDVTDVMIEIDKQVSPLEDALQSGKISENDIFYFARQDAQNGFCELSFNSNHSLTQFIFAYPNFKLALIYDIYATPDGSQHLISHLCVHHPDINLATNIYFYDEDGKRIDQEDWGLTFEITNVSNTGLTVVCTQNGSSQQIGELNLGGFHVSKDNVYLTRLDKSGETPPLDVHLKRENSTVVEIDWTEFFGELPSGEYTISLSIFDIFDKSQLHPLMDDFHHWQIYTMSLTIP